MTTEAEEQREFVAWYRETYPQYAHCLRVSMAGINFGRGPRAARMASWVNSQGITRGESDILIALPRNGYAALVIEHKAAGGTHKVTDKQQEYLDAHTATGNCATSTRGLEALKAAVSAYIQEAGQ